MFWNKPMKTESSVGAEAVQTACESRFSPLRNLEPETLVQYIEMYEGGDFSWMDRTMRAMERRDDVWKIAASKARKDISRRKWQVAPLEGFEKDPEASKQVETLKHFYSGIQSVGFDCRNVTSGVRGLIDGMMRAYNDGYSVQEIVWKPMPGGLSAQLIRCPLEWFRLSGGSLCLVGDGANQIPLEPGGWIATRGDGVGIACAVAYMFKRLSLGDWVVYSGRCGHPGIHGKTNAAKGSTQWTDFVAALRKFGKEWACATGIDDVIEKIDLSVQGTLPYPGLVERMDRAIASLQRGADLSTLSAGGGTGQGASLQGDEGDLIAADNCETITEALRNQLDPFVLEWTYGAGVEIKAGFRLIPPQRDTIDRDIKIDTALLQMGVNLSKRDALSRYERREVDPGDAEDSALVAAAGLTAPAPRLPLANERDITTDPIQRILGRAAAKIMDQGTPIADALASARAEISAIPSLASEIDDTALQSLLEKSMFDAAAKTTAKEKQ